MEGHNVNDLYKECLRNHAASLGSYATDGCGEFTLGSSPTSSPGTLHCAACGCHRNFHRKVTYSGEETTTVTEMIEYGRDGRAVMVTESDSGGGSGKKRFRTKFTVEQKEKMLNFAEKLGWKLQRSRDEEDEVEKFCRGIGVSRQVFKVWMHNHKKSSPFSSSSSPPPPPPPPPPTTTTGNASSLTIQ